MIDRWMTRPSALQRPLVGTVRNTSDFLDSWIGAPAGTLPEVIERRRESYSVPRAEPDVASLLYSTITDCEHEGVRDGQSPSSTEMTSRLRYPNLSRWLNKTCAHDSVTKRERWLMSPITTCSSHRVSHLNRLYGCLNTHHLGQP